jgi:hypothetical protein
MDISGIIEIIKRRQSHFRSPRPTAAQEPSDLVSRVMAEEYDSLLAEIETSRGSGEPASIVSPPQPDTANQAAEAEILGDQGQSGG